MKIAILSVTEGGKRMGLKLKRHLPESHLYVLSKFFKEEEDTLPIEPDLKTVVERLFPSIDYLIFIMATGIVVRSIAPYIVDKRQDPGVIVMDEKGQSVISLLSGHIGGANELTLKIASKIGANPVITTASDVQNTMAVDTLAQRLECKIYNWQLTKQITAHIVNGGEIDVFSEIRISFPLPINYHIVKNLEEISSTTYGIYIGNKAIENIEENLLQLYPQNLIIGVGCRKNTLASAVFSEIKEALRKCNRRIEAVKKIVTVDVKAEEEGLKEVTETLGIPLEIIERQQIVEIEEDFDISPFVKKTIGVGSVSEPCAYLGSQGGTMLLKKQKNHGVTISIAEEKERR
ncbi:cobalt-precorrin 5A acetaldehyde-lyase [Anaerovirgula multivorans]|uniref:Cobalt-precorrin 5A acetaldehyde-lyase n=1 Tax=Anaerovirgula multivorans TaxID=312168 RepID=A0A239EMI1_9FIRM|nr:cobalt-precorrin 5A hydrolase [Anaerovirgula multivorans]SNS45876.1 cobalt-precorrin 5A acetaldehyde-lyase [Anaerovirgula multivorans]